MDNKYVYLSSIDADNAADFTVQFPNTISISPYSQVRLISAHIKSANNTIQITDDNNTFYMGVDFWNKTTGSIPLTRITLSNNIYTLEEFAEHLQVNINLCIGEEYALFYEGCEVSLDRENDFQIVLNKVDLVGCPTIPIPITKIDSAPEFVYESWQENNIIPFVVKDDIVFERMGIRIDEVNVPVYSQDDEIFYGLTLATPTNDNSLFIGPSISSGLLRRTEFPISIVNIDLSGEGESIEGDDYVQVWCGLCRGEDFSDTENNLQWGNYLTDDPNTVAFETTHRFCLQFMSDRLRIVYTDLVEGLPVADIIDVLTSDGYDNEGKYFAKCYDYYNDASSYWYLYIIKEEGGIEDVIEEIEVRQNLIDKTTADWAGNSTKPNISFMKKGAKESYIAFSCAYFGDKQINYFNSQREEFYSKQYKNIFWQKQGRFTDRPISFFLNDNVEFGAFQTLMTGKSSIDLEGLYRFDMVLPENETATTGLVFYDYVKKKDYESYVFLEDVPTLNWLELNYSSLPQAYLEIRELPLNNFTANYLQGSAQKFISPINFNFDSQSDQSVSLYTSNPNTEQFLTMSNSSKMVLSSFRVRICDITGKVFPLVPDTVITLEIRDNPTLRKERAQEQFIASIISKMSNGGQPGTVGNAKALDGF